MPHIALIPGLKILALDAALARIPLPDTLRLRPMTPESLFA